MPDDLGEWDSYMDERGQWGLRQREEAPKPPPVPVDVVKVTREEALAKTSDAFAGVRYLESLGTDILLKTRWALPWTARGHDRKEAKTHMKQFRLARNTFGHVLGQVMQSNGELCTFPRTLWDALDSWIQLAHDTRISLTTVSPYR